MRPELDWLHSETLVSKSFLLLNGRREMKWGGRAGRKRQENQCHIPVPRGTAQSGLRY